MLYYIDTARTDVVEDLMPFGCLSGVTINPVLAN